MVVGARRGRRGPVVERCGRCSVLVEVGKYTARSRYSDAALCDRCGSVPMASQLGSGQLFDVPAPKRPDPTDVPFMRLLGEMVAARRAGGAIDAPAAGGVTEEDIRCDCGCEDPVEPCDCGECRDDAGANIDADVVYEPEPDGVPVEGRAYSTPWWRPELAESIRSQAASGVIREFAGDLRLA